VVLFALAAYIGVVPITIAKTTSNVSFFIILGISSIKFFYLNLIEIMLCNVRCALPLKIVFPDLHPN
jgi:hypothetical protein